METILSGIASFFLFHFATHPGSKINKKLSMAQSKKIIKRFEIFPRVNFEAKNKTFHIHHWMILAPLFVVAETVGRGIGFLQSDLMHGFMIGGLLQGLLYKDSFKIIHHNKDYRKKITTTTYHRLPRIKRGK